jgi:hypothetical protein
LLALCCEITPCVECLTWPSFHARIGMLCTARDVATFDIRALDSSFFPLLRRFELISRPPSSHSHSLSWPPVATTSINVVRHDVSFASSRRRSILPTLSHRSTLHTRARGAQRVERRGHVHSAGPPSLSPHSHPAHGHAPSSIAAIHMHNFLTVSFHPASCLLTTDEDSSHPGNSSWGGCAIQLTKIASTACHTIHRFVMV